MANIVVDFLRNFAQQHSFSIFDSIYGDIFTTSITQSSGAVYGIWVESSTIIDPLVSSIPNNPTWYPVYWGKDIAPVSRIRSHSQGHSNNGNINIPSINSISNKKIIYGAILVSKYLVFEQMLHQTHKPLFGTTRVGKTSKLINITY